MGEGPLTGRVDWVESLGAEALLHVELGPHRVIVQVAEPTAIQAGDTLRLGIKTMHAFDKITGTRLAGRDE